MYNNNNNNNNISNRNMYNYNNQPQQNNQQSLIQQDQIFRVSQYTQNMRGSQYTSAQTVHSLNSHNNVNDQSQQNFHYNRMYVFNTLQNWGIKIGNLTYSKDNQLVLNCLLQLISQRQKDTQYTNKIKEQINSIQFQKDKYQSLLKLSKNQLSQKLKLLGKMENQNFQIKKKIKQIQTITKKQKYQDNKVINLLKSKNQQILHEVKKKQAQIQRIKQQMKRNITNPMTKSTSIKQKQIPIKNSIQFIQKVQNMYKSKSIKSKKIINLQTDSYQQRINFLIQKHQKQKKLFTNENTVLRSKIFEIRQILVKFAQYIDIQLYGIIDDKKTYQNKKFIINHNLLFNQNCLINDLIQIIQQAKNGINQLQQNWMSNMNNNNSPDKKSNKINSCKKIINQLPSEQSINMKKKSISSSSQNNRMTYIPNIQKFNNINTNSNINSNSNIDSKINMPSRSTGVRQLGAKVSININNSLNNNNKQLNKEILKNEIRSSNNLSKDEQIFDNDILSDIYDNQDIDNSIISYISTSELEKQAQKYSKWDVLFMKDDHQ